MQPQFLSFTITATISFIYTKHLNLLLTRNDDAGTLLIRNWAYSYQFENVAFQKQQ